MFASATCYSLKSIPTREVLTTERDAQRHDVKEGALRAETKARAVAKIKWVARKKRQGSVLEVTNYICTSSNKGCHSRIVLLSLSRAYRH